MNQQDAARSAQHARDSQAVQTVQGAQARGSTFSVSPCSVVHHHLRVTYDRIQHEAMRRLRQKGDLPTNVLDELEARWRSHLDSMFDKPELHTVAAKSREIKRVLDFLQGERDPKRLNLGDKGIAPPLMADNGLANFDEEKARRALAASFPSTEQPLFHSIAFPQPGQAQKAPAIEDSASSGDDEGYEELLDGVVVEAEQTGGGGDPGLLVDGDRAAAEGCREDAPKLPLEVPETSPIEDVPQEGDEGSALGSDLDTDWSEPEVTDEIFAAKVEVKSRTRGVWRVQLHDGVCKINREEALFKRAECTFVFYDSDTL